MQLAVSFPSLVESRVQAIKSSRVMLSWKRIIDGVQWFWSYVCDCVVKARPPPTLVLPQSAFLLLSGIPVSDVPLRLIYFYQVCVCRCTLWFAMICVWVHPKIHVFISTTDRTCVISAVRIQWLGNSGAAFFTWNSETSLFCSTLQWLNPWCSPVVTFECSIRLDLTSNIRYPLITLITFKYILGMRFIFMVIFWVLEWQSIYHASGLCAANGGTLLLITRTAYRWSFSNKTVLISPGM